MKYFSAEMQLEVILFPDQGNKTPTLNPVMTKYREVIPQWSINWYIFLSTDMKNKTAHCSWFAVSCDRKANVTFL